MPSAIEQPSTAPDITCSPSSTPRSSSVNSTLDDVHVLVIGGGITGLLIGQAHRKAGRTCTIFESEPPFIYRQQDWTIAIHWSIPYLAKILPSSLFARMKEAYCDPSHTFGPEDGVEIFNGATGAQLKKIVPPDGMMRISRRRMRKHCTEGLHVEHGKKLVDITYGAERGVTAHFADGTCAVGDILIGADGPTSTVRSLLVGREKATTTTVGLNFNSFLINYHDAEKAKFVRSLHPVAALAYHPSGIFSFISVADIPNPSDPTTWSFQLACSWLGARDPSLTLVKARMKSFVEPFASAFAWIPEDTPSNNGGIRYWTPLPWDNHAGCVTLAGDAAHPMPPHRGQGLNVCIYDVADLSSHLESVRCGERRLADAITEYDTSVVQRGREEVSASVESALLVHDWSRLTEAPVMKQGLTRG